MNAARTDALHYREDAGKLARAPKTATGGARIDATLALTNVVLKYRRPDGTIQREWFPPEEAQDQEYLDSINATPITYLHPPKGQMVNAKNVRELQRGHKSGARYDAADHGVHADCFVLDHELLGKLDSGEIDGASEGYYCKLEPANGRKTPWGAEIDFIQRKRRVNHDAFGPGGGWARAGAGAGPHLDAVDDGIPLLDAAGNCTWNDPAATPVREARTDGQERIMVKIRIDGVDHEVGSDTAAQAVTKALADRDAALAAEKTAAEKARKDASDAQAKLDAETKAHADTKAALAKASDPAVRAAEAAAVAKLDADCKRLAPEVKLDGLDAAAKKKAALVAAKINLDGKDDAYIASRFDAELDRLPALESARNQLAATRRAGEGHVDAERTDGRSAYDKNTERLHNRWKNPRGQAAKVEG